MPAQEARVLATFMRIFGIPLSEVSAYRFFPDRQGFAVVIACASLAMSVYMRHRAEVALKPNELSKQADLKEDTTFP